MAIYVIADLHLSEHDVINLASFGLFVESIEDNSRLYILGDLFNFFVGRMRFDPAQRAVRFALQEARQRGIHTYFIHGNRDFLIDQNEAYSLGMELCEDVVCLDLEPDLKLMLTHGDLFCSNDLEYLKYRERVNQPWLQNLFRMLPLRLRYWIGNRLRSQSQSQQGEREAIPRSESKYGVVPDTVERMACEELAKLHALESSQCLVVHGHVHDFSVHPREGEHLRQRFVLGAWEREISFFKVIEQQNLAPEELAKQVNVQLQFGHFSKVTQVLSSSSSRYSFQLVKLKVNAPQYPSLSVEKGDK